MRLEKKKLTCGLIDRDFTQKELAKKTGLSQVTVSSIMCGRSCTYETGKKIADALGMKLEDLLEKR